MTGVLLSSGIPAADQRAGIAESMAHLGDMATAIVVLRQALDLAPRWYAGWFRLGEYFKAVSAPDEAATAWTMAVACDPCDPLGAGINRDLLRDTPLTETMPPAFVETLFDQYAPRFETSLCAKLNYRGPELLLEALRPALPARHALDLGCGTGLMGAALRPHVARLDGYDISQGMLSEAEMRGDYDHLAKRDIARLDRETESYDLIVAADVFIYLGALESVIAWCRDALCAGGTLAFTVELGDAPIALRDTRRFAHSHAYVQTLMADAGFAEVTLTPAVLREDRGTPVQALVVTAQAPGARQRDGDETAAYA